MRETLWSNYTMLLNAYTYYAALDGTHGEHDSRSHQISRYLGKIIRVREPNPRMFCLLLREIISRRFGSDCYVVEE